MRANSLNRTAFLAIAAALFGGCDVDAAFVPGGGGGGFRIAWPSTTAAVEDSATFAIAIFPFAGPEGVTFTASLDGGPSISGLRNESDSVVAFRLDGLTNGPHSIRVQATTGAVLTRDFTVSLVARPSITDVTPDTAVLGANQLITITGTNFIANAQRMRVYLNGVRLPISGIPTTTQVRATVQETTFGPVRTGLISVEADRRISRELEPFRVDGGSAPLPGQAQIFLADPSLAPRNAPVVLSGKGFTAGDIPSFGTSPSAPLLILGSDNLGEPVDIVTFGLTIVPPLAPRQDGFVTIQTDAGTSTSFPFFVD